MGHTHVPALVSSQIGVMEFKKEHEYLINPGSVGQSRDGDYRASCCIVDTDSWKSEFLRVEYNIEEVLIELSKLGFSSLESHQLLKY